jgi:hypothetical protein
MVDRVETRLRVVIQPGTTFDNLKVIGLRCGGNPCPPLFRYYKP